MAADAAFALLASIAAGAEATVPADEPTRSLSAEGYEGPDISRAFDHADMGCIDARWATAVAARIQSPIFFEGFQDSLCNNHMPAKRVLNALWFMAAGKFAPAPVSDRSSFFAFVLERIASIRVDWSPAGVLLARYEPLRQIEVGPEFFELPLVMMAATMVHEARHADGHLHVDCLTPVFRSMAFDACDSALSSAGSYAFEAEFLSMLASSPTFSERARRMAKAVVTDILLRLVNEPPLDVATKLILVERASNRVFGLDASMGLDAGGSLPPVRFAVADWDGVWIVPRDESQPNLLLDIYDLRADAASAQNANSDFRRRALGAWTAEVRRSLVALMPPIEFVRGLALFADRLELSFFDDRLVSSFGSPGEIATAAAPAWMCAGETEDVASSVVVRFASGRIRRYGAQGEILESQSCAWPENAIDFERFNGRTLALMHDGSVQEMAPTGALAPFAPLFGRRFSAFRAAQYLRRFQGAEDAEERQSAAP